MVNIYKTVLFSKFASKIKLEDEKMVREVEKIEMGSDYNDLGGSLIKLRISHGSRGKSHGIRAFCAYAKGVICVFLDGVLKKNDNLTLKKKSALKKMAKEFKNFSQTELQIAISQGTLIEVIQP